MLWGLWLVLSLFSFFLFTGIVLTFLNSCGNSPISMEKLKCKQMKLEKISGFIVIILVWISFNWYLSCTFMPLIFLLISILLVCVKEKIDLRFFALIFLIPGWSWNIDWCEDRISYISHVCNILFRIYLGLEVQK